MSARLAAPSALRNQNLTLSDGSLTKPAFRWRKEPGSGFARLAAGYTATVINGFRALEVGANDTLVRSNSAGAGNVVPFGFARANATTADGQETAIDGYEVAARVGRLSLYRQTSTKYGWKLYGSTSGSLSGSADLTADADGFVTARTGLAAPTLALSATAGNTALNIPNGNVVLTVGTLTLSRVAGSNALVINNANALIGGSLSVTGNITSSAVLNGASVSVTGGVNAGTGITANGGGIAIYAPNGNINTGGSVNGGAFNGTSLNVGGGAIAGGAITGSSLVLSSGISASFLGVSGSVTANTLVAVAASISGAVSASTLSASSSGSALSVTGFATIGSSLSVMGGRMLAIFGSGAASQIVQAANSGERVEYVLQLFGGTHYGVIGLSASGGQYLSGFAGELSIYSTNGRVILGANSVAKLYVGTLGVDVVGTLGVVGNIGTTGSISANQGYQGFGTPSGRIMSVSGATVTVGSPGAASHFCYIDIGGVTYRMHLTPA